MLLFSPLFSYAQYNYDRMLTAGRIALSYSDYVLSIHYFNQIINAKPNLYEPWYLRSVAKFNLDDYLGAAIDCDKAIQLNPYIVEMYHLHGICAIKQKDYDKAIADYDKAIEMQNNNKDYWYNRTVCYLEKKDYDKVHENVDTIMKRWDKSAHLYLLDADAYLNQCDTIKGVECIRKSLDIDEYNGKAWEFLAMISLSNKEWKKADKDLTKAIHYRPNFAPHYLNRALARVNTNNLRGALADYDKTIELDPNNMTAHYNRAVMRLQVGDDNRALVDFDFIVQHEPRNVMARFNRALLRQNTGDASGAIEDYTIILNEFPNSWYVSQQRATLYRKIGQTNKAELDEFKIFNEQNDKHYGINAQRWSKSKIYEVRKRSEIDFTKYKMLIVEDTVKVEHEDIKEEFTGMRGRIQNRNVEERFLDQILVSKEELAADSLLNSPIAIYNEGCVAANEARYDDAIELFNKAIALDPRFDRALFNRGLALIKKERKDEALKDFSMAGELGITQAYSLLKKYSK